MSGHCIIGCVQPHFGAQALMKQGFNILIGGTDNHLMLVDLCNMDISEKELQNRCDEVTKLCTKYPIYG